MNPSQTAVILIGFQNDYFAADGVLRKVVEEGAVTGNVLPNTLELIRSLWDSPVQMVSTPIQFTEGYTELQDPVGILRAIRDVGAFRAGTRGGATIPELEALGERVVSVPGKRGLNAFSNTDLDHYLRERGVRDVVLAGVVTAVCIDSTGRSAFERGYRVTVLSDCTVGRSQLEQRFYLDQVFPLYAGVMDRHQLLAALSAPQ
jgi:nicotinamidase-related amidase